jgi:hypothetical protein
MKSRGRGLLCWAGLALGAVLSSCAGSARSSKTEDEARTLVPVPICLERLPRRATPGSIVALEAREYWSLLIPGFAPGASGFAPTRPDCSGRSTLESALGGSAQRPVHPEELVLGGGSDGFKVAWLPLFAEEDSRLGLLALVRQRAEFLEVYALGTHQGSVGSTRFSLERMGPALVVTALEEHCRGGEGERRCDAWCTVYLMANGRLRARARFPLDHSADSSVSALAGAAEYRFSASAEYQPGGIALSEKLSVLEKGRGEVRSIALERMLRLEGDRLAASADSLWVQTARQIGLPEGP